jgi:uncharacterized protein (TIGR03435 family)
MIRSRLVPVCVIACALAGVAAAQSGDSEPALTFEVASIKLNPSVDTNMSINTKPGGQLECTNVTLRMLIQFAYDVRDHEVSNLPAWANTDHFDVFAKPSAEDALQESGRWKDPEVSRLRRRTQSLLKERFGLAVHTESRELPVYNLVVAKGGAKLTPTKQPADASPQSTWNSQRVSAKKITMQRFARTILAARLGRNVIDKTGLDGEFDIEMKYVSDDGLAKDSTVQGADFAGALQEQLGLKLEATKGPVNVLVIDKVEKPSAN